MPVESRILVANHDPEVLGYLTMALRSGGHMVESAREGVEAVALLHRLRGQFSAIVLDVSMPRKGGMETLLEVKAAYPKVPVIMTCDTAAGAAVVTAMRAGATDFMVTPASAEDLHRTIRKAIAPDTGSVPVNDAPVRDSSKVYWGQSARLREIRSLTSQISKSDVPVLIRGETGTGKEVATRQIHANSLRAGKPFLKLNCAALPSELVESELFGYERGAFTGALQRKPGMFEIAEGGTLLLDEIGDMDFKLQAKLLQVLQDRTMQRLGGKETINVDVRIIAATHRDLEKAIVDSLFREDLYYRLNVVTLDLPTLRECREDILPLAEFLIRKHTAEETPLVRMTPELKAAMLAHDWPGNVRELENVIRRLIVFRNPEQVTQDIVNKSRHIAAHPVAAPPQETRPATPVFQNLGSAKRDAEVSAILTALHATHWNRKHAAELLKVDYKALLYKMKKLAIAAGSTASSAAKG